jgi:hypothetical protein
MATTGCFSRLLGTHDNRGSADEIGSFDLANVPKFR